MITQSQIMPIQLLSNVRLGIFNDNAESDSAYSMITLGQTPPPLH